MTKKLIALLLFMVGLLSSVEIKAQALRWLCNFGKKWSERIEMRQGITGQVVTRVNPVNVSVIGRHTDWRIRPLPSNATHQVITIADKFPNHRELDSLYMFHLPSKESKQCEELQIIPLTKEISSVESSSQGKITNTPKADGTTCSLLSPEDNKRWIELGKEIGELGIRLGLEQKMKLLFNKGIKFDLKKKNDLVGYMILCNDGYEYKIDAA